MAFQDAMNPLLAGAIAGSTSLLVVHPMDTIRTRLQVSEKGKYSGAVDCFRDTIRHEGPRALYKGILPPFLAQGLYKSVMFGSVHHITRAMSRYNDGAPLSQYQLLLSGSMAGIINSLVVTPVELLRNRLMVNRTDPTITVRSIVRDVVSQHGILGLWKGQLSCSLRDAFGVGAFFYGNNRATKWLRENTSLAPSTAQLFAGMVAGICFWTFALPFDRVKAITQTQASTNDANVGKILTQIFKNEGIRGLYKGLTVGFGRGIPSGALVFYVNHIVLNRLNSRTQQQNNKRVV